MLGVLFPHIFYSTFEKAMFVHLAKTEGSSNTIFYFFQESVALVQ